MITKDTIVKAMQNLPDDAGYEDAIDTLYVLYKVEKGFEASEAGDKVPLAEARRLMARWVLDDEAPERTTRDGND